ncbi:ubiquinone biosynthesis protein UbiA [Halobacteriales archaeon QH_8_64_26]|nr:MAG: ubiquinone biosynthesis protein UbiA [Halobacteriales archaeon QH_8_64_26]
MEVARHGSGARAVFEALASQVHPVFMLPPLAASAFGAVLTREFAPVVGVLHTVAIFFALYTAHLKDGYVDFHLRGEDDDYPITAAGCRLALGLSSALFFLCLGGLWWLSGIGAALLTLPTWLIAYFHAPQLDTNPVSATTGYPLGIAVSLLGGYYVQAGGLSLVALAFAAVFLLLLSGIKVIDDAKDYEYDRSIAKRTVAVALGRDRARLTAYGLMAGGLLVVLAFAALSIFPPSAVFAVLAFASVALIARHAESELATMLLIRGSYVFLAVLVVAVWYRPFE